MEERKSPQDYAVGDWITFHDPHVHQSISGIIREITQEKEGECGDWSQVMFRIETNWIRPETGKNAWASFHTGIYATTDLYWFGGDPEAECTPEESGCYLISEHVGEGSLGTYPGEMSKRCIGCNGKTYRVATRGDGQLDIERCDVCSPNLTDQEALQLALRQLERGA